MTSGINNNDNYFKNLMIDLFEKTEKQKDAKEIEKADIANIFAKDGIDADKNGKISFEEFMSAAGSEFDIDVLDDLSAKEYKNLIEVYSDEFDDFAQDFIDKTKIETVGPEFVATSGNGNTLSVDLRDDLVKNGMATVEGNADTGYFKITFGKSNSAGETSETNKADDKSEMNNTKETPTTNNSEETQGSETTSKLEGNAKPVDDIVDFTYVESNGQVHNINVESGWTNLVKLDDNRVMIEYPDGSAYIASISGSGEVGGTDKNDDAVKPSGKGDDDKAVTSNNKGDDDKTNTSNDKVNGYTVPDGSKPEYTVNVGGKNISVDIPDELRDQIKTVINTKTGEVSFKDRQGNDIKAEDINALVNGAKTDKTDKADASTEVNKPNKVDDKSEVDKTASLFKKDDRIKTDDKGNKYAEVTQWNDKYSENNCLYRIIDHSYDLDAMGIPRDEKGYPIDTDPKYVALEKAIMNANPEIYGNENGGWNPPPNGLTGRRNATINPGDKIVLPEAYDIEELGIERPKVEKNDENKTDKPDVNDVKNEKAEVAIENKNGTFLIDFDDVYFTTSREDLVARSPANSDEISFALFKDFDDYKEDVNEILSQQYNKDAKSQLIQEIKQSTDLNETQRKELLAMFEEE